MNNCFNTVNMNITFSLNHRKTFFERDTNIILFSLIGEGLK